MIKLKLNHKLFLLIISQFIFNTTSLYSMDASATANVLRNIINNSQRISQALCSAAVYSWNKLSSKDIVKQPIVSTSSNKVKIDMKMLREQFPSAYQQFLLLDKHLNWDLNAIIEKNIQSQAVVVNDEIKPLSIPDMPAAIPTPSVTLPKLQEIDEIVIDLVEFQKLIRQRDIGLLGELTKVDENPKYKIPTLDNRFKIPEFHQKIEAGQSQFGAKFWTTPSNQINQNVYLSESDILDIQNYIKNIVELIDILKQSNGADLATRLSQRLKLVEIGLNIPDSQKNVIRSLNYLYEYYFHKDGTIKFDVINQSELETAVKILFDDPNLINLMIYFTPEYHNLIPTEHYSSNIFFGPSSYKNFVYTIRDNDICSSLKTIQNYFDNGQMSLACNVAYTSKHKEVRLLFDALVKQKFKFNVEGIILQGQNDPRWVSLSPQQKQNIKKDSVAFYNLNFDLYYRSLLKEYFKEKFSISKSSGVIDNVIYKLIDTPFNDKMYMKILFDVAKNAPKNSPVFNAFYNENGVLKCYENHPLSEAFKLNPNLPQNIQHKFIITINRLLGFEYAKNKNIIDQSFSYLTHAANNIDESPAFLDLVHGICEALDGNQPYTILLKEKNFLAINDKKERIDAIKTAFDKVEKLKKGLLLAEKEKASSKEKDKSPSLDPNPSIDPNGNDPDKDKNKRDVDKKNNYYKQTKEQLLKSMRAFEKLAKEHIKKLDDYIKNPDAYDNENLLKNAPNNSVREKIIRGRIKALKDDIFKQQGEARVIKEVLKERFNFELGIQSKL